MFVYDGIEEHCFFAAPITITAIRELSKVVGYEAEVKLGCAYQVAPYQGHASKTDRLNITPKDKVEHKIDWNTNMVSMIFNARQETYTEPTETFTITLVGTKENRDALMKLFNLHGTMPFTFTFDNQDYQVRFPDAIEIVDKRSMTQILGFESSFELEVVKAPNDGTYNKEVHHTAPAIHVKEDLSLRDWYENGCMINGISYKDNLTVGLEKLQNFYITDCQNAFFEAPDVYEIPELDTSKCKYFNGMFCGSSVKIVKGLDLSKAIDVTSMFEASKVESVPFSFDMPLCVSAQCMFRGAADIRTLPSITLGKCAMPREMFRAASSLMKIDGLSIPQAVNLNYLFAGTALEAVPTLNFPNAKQAVFMFGGCNSLKSVSFKNSGVLENVGGMFLYCFALVSIDGLNLTAVVPNEYPRFSRLHPGEITDKCLYLDMFVNHSDDYYNMFAIDPNDSYNYPYIGLHPDNQVNLYGSSLKTLNVIEDNKLSPSELMDKYYSSMTLGGLVYAEMNQQGEILSEHYYRYHNTIDTLTVVNSEGERVVQYKKTDKYDGYEWIEDFRENQYGSGG